MDEESTFRLYTKEEADARGIGYDPQVEIRCPHCGEPYEQQGFIGRAGRIAWVTHRECQCEGAVAEREQARQAEAEAKRMESQRRLKRCGVPRRYMSAQISVPEAARYVVGFGSAGDKGLYIVGGVGTGKTYEACALAKSFIEAGYTVRVTTSLAMLDSVSRSYDDPSIAGISIFTGVDVLVIDDLGKENANAWALTTTCSRSSTHATRTASRPSTTSQYDLQSLQRHMSRQHGSESAEAIVSRICETSTIVQLGGKDRRRSAGEIALIRNTRANPKTASRRQSKSNQCYLGERAGGWLGPTNHQARARPAQTVHRERQAYGRYDSGFRAKIQAPRRGDARAARL